MSNVYVIRNQHGHFWGKKKVWVSGADAKTLMRAKHEDEAINSLFELSAKDIELRGEVVAATLSERGEPMVEASDVPLPDAVQPDEAQPETTLSETPLSAETDSPEAETISAVEAANMDTEKAS